MNVKFFASIFIVTALFFSACEDQGTAPVISPDPSISGINPSAALAADTITISGSNFSTAGSGKVKIGSDSVAIISWSDTQIKAVIPSSASAGSKSVIVTSNGKTSSTKTLKVISIADIVKFSSGVKPLITLYNCASCHPGNGGFSVASYATIMAGGSHGSTVVPGNGAGSNIVKKLLGTAGFGSRMPQGEAPMTGTEIQMIADWIDQGAKNN